ncbi:enoyl-CoA hydratase/isomerase family protein [Caulobacter sp. DWR1-3-2b1]|uniref:enoyl-CoA hydratase/isomerase family protein n=1 Tax=Caulobacter sp. DWR1-3-2b1 TaxID=2804670 RepID=UPI003CF8BAB1
MILIDPANGWPDISEHPWPLGFINLETWREPAAMGVAPFPLIGLGASTHPSAAWVDAVVEPPVSAEALISQVNANPNAATVAVQVLRALEGVAVEQALTLESLAYGMLQGSAEHGAWLAERTASPSPPGRVLMTREDAVLRITLDRPWARNAIDRTMRDELFQAFTVAASDQDIQRVELRSIGPAFSVGGDLDEFGVTRDPATAHRIRSLTLPARPLSRRAEIVHVHIQGACVGAGLEIAAFAGRITASPKAWFQLPELAMSLIPGAGGCVSIARRIGRQRTALLLLSGRRINAATALDWGLIDAIEDRPPIDPGGADPHLS